MHNFCKFGSSNDYIVAPHLQDAVNVSIALQKPLLVRGEPGTGKTLLAEAIAKNLGLNLICWHVKSTSKAGEGLYTYDTVQRLNDSRFAEGNVSDIKQYIKMGPLGQAFQSPEQTVVLIDEVDKADIEFPNDLLHELDAMAFTVVETGETVQAQTRPIFVITSNAEKELPDAFLRRCIFHYIEFPDSDQMREIIEVHHPNLDRNLLDLCLQKFYWLREQDEIRKRPSTSELIDWISALIKGGIDPKEVKKSLPFSGVLLKKETDMQSIGSDRSRRLY